MRAVFNTAQFVTKPGRAGMLAARSGLAAPVFAYDFTAGQINPIIGGGTTSVSVSANGTRVNSAGLIEQAVANTARFDYNPVTLAIRGLLIEGARTNLVLQSILPGGGPAPTGWSCPGGTGTSAPAASILGNNDGAVAYLQSATAQRPFLQQTTASLTADTTYALSVVVESLTGTVIAGNALLWINGPTGATESFPVCEANPSGGRFSTITTGVLIVLVTYAATPGPVTTRVGLGCSSATTGTMQFSRPQFEVGTFATSFIPDTTASVARAADAYSIAFNPGTQGTFVWEGIAFTATTNPVDQVLFELGDGTANERIVVKRNATTGAVSAVITDGGVIQDTLTTANVMAAGVVSRVAMAFGANDFGLCLNGGALDTGTGTVPALTTIYHGHAYDNSLHLNGWARKLAFYPRRVINDRLPNLYP